MTPPILHKMNWWCELPKLDLTTALQIKGASGEFLQLKGQGFSWKKQTTTSALSTYYGSGDGHILIDWRVDAPVLSGAQVQSVRNDGGLGAGYNLVQRSTLPLPDASGLTMITGGGKQLQITGTNSVDLINTHVSIVANTRAATAVSPILAQDASTSLSYIEFVNTFVRFRTRGGTILGTINYPDVDALRLFEIRWNGATAHLAINGAVVGSLATTAQAAWPMRFVGGGRGDRPAHGFIGPVGRIIMTKVQSGYSMAAPEPAVLAARQVLGAQYGVVLT